jgi:hypothetical protein
MALIAGCSQPYPDLTSVDAVPIPITNRFPVPVVAWGFGVDIEDALGPIQGLTPPYAIAGAVNPEALYLEPNIGQIWPRIG